MCRQAQPRKRAQHCIGGRSNAVAKLRLYKTATKEDMFLFRAYAWRDFSILSQLSATSGTGLYVTRKAIRPPADFTQALLYWRSSGHLSGGMQVPVERATPRAGQERRP